MAELFDPALLRASMAALAPLEHDMTNLVTIENLVYKAKPQFEAVTVDRSITFDREAGFAVQVLMGSDFAMKTAMQNQQSVINAVSNIAAIGLSLNPAKRQAYLVPRDGKICLDIGYIGLLDLAIESGSIRWGQAELVHAADRFVLNGVDKPPTHERDPFKPDRGDIIGAYVVVKTRDGDYLTTTMPLAELIGIRDRSSAWKNGQKGPWKTDPGEMMKKTVVKRAYKLWPKTDQLDRAIHHLNTEGEEGLPAIDNEPRSKSGISAQKEAKLRASLDAAIEKFDVGNEYGAYEELMWCEDDPDDSTELLLMIWNRLGRDRSAMRRSLKEHGAARRARDAEIAGMPSATESVEQ